MFMRNEKSLLRIPPYRTPEVPPNRIEVSPVLFPPGNTTLSIQVLPPSVETNIGQLPELLGSGVKADAAICIGFAGFTATLGSLSRCVSALTEFGIMFTTFT